MMIKVKNINWFLSYVAILAMSIQPIAQAKESAELIANVSSMKAMNAKALNKSLSQSLNPQNKLYSTKKTVPEKKPEQLLSELSQEIYWDLYDWNEKDIRSFSADQKVKITNWQTKLTELHQQVMTEMDVLTAWIDEKKLSPVIKQRQQDAINHINTEVAGLKAHLTQMSQNTLEANTEEAVSQSLTASFEFFEGKQLKRKHQVFDGLSSVALTPDRIPAAKSATEFSKYQFESHSKSFPANTKNFTDPALLSTSDEVVINDFITEKATELENDPVKIYHWVRNNIEWLPSYGAVQASDITLGSGRGNAFDQSSLLIALLRASNVPSRYAYGTIEIEIDRFTNWVGLSNPEAAITFAQYGGIPIATVIEGGVITKVQMEHIWVEAAIDFMPSRGAVNITPDSWVTLDPSFKQYETLTGLDPITISGQDMEQLAQDFIDSGTSNETEGWVHGFDPSVLTNAQEQMQQSLTIHIEDNITDPTVGDVIGGRRTIKQEYPVLPASTMNRIVVKAADFIQVPENMRPKYRLAFDRDITGQIHNPLELNFAQLNNHKLTLSFKPETTADQAVIKTLIPENITDFDEIPTNIPAHLIKVIPQVALDEEVVKQGSPMSLGYDLTLYYQVYLPTQGTLNKQYSLPAGSYVNLMMGAGSVSNEALSTTDRRIQSTVSVLESEDVEQIKFLNRKNILGDTYSAGGMGYISQYETVNSIFSEKLNAKFNVQPVFGSYGSESNVDYLFGLPRSISKGGVAANVYTTRQIIAEDNTAESLKNMNLLTGVVTSALESSISEQLFQPSIDSPVGISTINALSMAISQNQRLYEINQANTNAIDSLNFDSETISMINQATSAGYTVITHTDPLTVASWSGAGFAVINEQTGDASWLISGGSNGSFYDFCQEEGAEHGFCSAYTEVYECNNPPDGDLTCAVIYTVGAGIISLLTIVGASVALIAAVAAALSSIDNIYWSDLPFSIKAFLLIGVIIAAIIGLFVGIFAGLVLLLIISALTIFIPSFLNTLSEREMP